MDQTINPWPVVVRRGRNLNTTLATVYYDRWGAKTRQKTIIVDDWQQGIDQARQQGYRSALFVDSGTVFSDWPTWKEFVDRYPHSGLIGHIIMNPGQRPYLDQQCWFMDLELRLDDTGTVTHPEPIRSNKNLHDDYTPLWIKPGTGRVQYDIDKFGQSLIAQQLNRGREVVNWTSSARDLKKYIYKNDLIDFFQDYVRLAENQFWIFNNEPVQVVCKEKIVCPGSGLFWILNIISKETRSIDIVDISDVQIEFCHEVWRNWDGHDYGSFVVDFIQKKSIKHYELDRADMPKLERLRLKNHDLLKHYINDKFESILRQANVNDFQRLWLAAKQSKTVVIQRGNLVDWILDNGYTNHMWASNILDYKWTLLHTSYEKCQTFRDMMK